MEIIEDFSRVNSKLFGLHMLLWRVQARGSVNLHAWSESIRFLGTEPSSMEGSKTFGFKKKGSECLEDPHISVLVRVVFYYSRIARWTPQIKERVLVEAHMTPYSIHSDSTKCIKIWKEVFDGKVWREILLFVEQYSTYRKVKVEH